MASSATTGSVVPATPSVGVTTSATTVSPSPSPKPSPSASATSASNQGGTAAAPDIPTPPGAFVVRGFLLVNKQHRLPATYAPPWASARDGLAPEVRRQLDAMIADAASKKIVLRVRSGYRSYAAQKQSYATAVQQYGVAKASLYFAQPGASEHQTGLVADMTDQAGRRGVAFRGTPQALYLAANAHRFGFIIRYLDGKSAITGYEWEPWHVRYVGVAAASEIKAKGLTLEQYLGQA